MKITLLNLLCCPKCKGDLHCDTPRNGEIETAVLSCHACNRNYPVNNGIPRFVEADNYAASFGYQWNLFRKEQIDTYNGTDLSAKRVWSETGWTPEAIKDKWILDAGCGAGRFLDAISHSEAEIVGIDISSAIDAAQENLRGRKNVHFVQASIYELPFREGTFDFCYCIGVIQHTPDPDKTVRSVAKTVKPGGEVALTIYEDRHWYTRLYSKYWFRPITKRLSKETLLKIVEGAMPVLFPITEVLFRIPKLGKFFSFVIPVANYVDEKSLSKEQRYSWAILDTFDMLSPQFDQPQSEEAVTRALSESGVTQIHRQTDVGLNLVGQRR